jgi:hypothetical protein
VGFVDHYLRFVSLVDDLLGAGENFLLAFCPELGKLMLTRKEAVYGDAKTAEEEKSGPRLARCFR